MAELDLRDAYKISMIEKIVRWDWQKPAWNQYTSFFDDAITLLTDKKKIIDEFNRREKEFEDKYGLTIAQAEIKIFLRITGQSNKKLVRSSERRYDSHKNRYVYDSASDREINWLEMLEDVRRIRVWIQNEVRKMAGDMGILNMG